MQASHWVIEDIVKAIESKDKKKIESAFKEFYKRYPHDTEIVKLCKEYLKTKDSKLLNQMKARLRVLAGERKMENAGGSQLWFGDRRGKGGQTLR